ncbi:MAG TPA: hypothetical protein DCM28_20070 [Phycisphaerales bacterium]|nr:hypothetical protein [Phycisphaerales bacterium]HCD33693.1 hypothetical protein [Phycisphaerales bacterium]|tara:strand:- start:677 stop:1819 length:1143 start_codon:yes stop_codon:yes gene_type:complete
MSQNNASTLAQVSAKAGCSPATVSRVLNCSGPVSGSVRENVLKAVKESGYIPRRTHKTLSSNSQVSIERKNNQHDLFEVVLYRCTPAERLTAESGKLTVGSSRMLTEKLLFSKNFTLTADFYMHIISGVMDELASASKRAMIQTSTDLMSLSLLKAVNQSEIGGVILLGEYPPKLDTFLEKCTKHVVLVDIIHPGIADIVTIDNMAGISLAMDHLIQLGHRKIGYVGAPFNKSYEERWVTWKWKMTGAGLSINNQWVYQGSNKIQDTTKGLQQMLSQTDRPTALVCASDWSAFGALRAAETLQIAIPEQISIIGFDDINAAAMVTPSLTTLHAPLREMGEQAARQILYNNLFNRSRHGTGVTTRLMPQLVIRNSTSHYTE